MSKAEMKALAENIYDDSLATYEDQVELIAQLLNVTGVNPTLVMERLDEIVEEEDDS